MKLRSVITSRLGLSVVLRISTAERLAREKVHPLHVKIFREFGFGRSVFVAIEALDDLALDETNLSR